MWNNVPYIDEAAYDRNNPGGVLVANTTDIWPKIEADFKFAADNLPTTQAQKGSATKWSALAYLGKAQLFQKKWMGKSLPRKSMESTGCILVIQICL